VNLKSLACGLSIVLALLASLVSRAPASGQPMFYIEVPKDGHIYVFAIGQRYDSFRKSGGTEAGTPVITRPGYGPQRETVVFDSEDAINLYNFKHNLPGEYFPPRASYPSGKFSGLMFGDYYDYDKWHADQISPTDPTSVEGQDGLWFRRIFLGYDAGLSEKFATRFRIEANSNGHFAGGNLVPFVKDAFLKWTYKGEHAATLGIEPTLTFEWLDTFWGLRHVEKSPADLYKIDSSRDFGIEFTGPVGIEGLRYGAQFGNESGSGSEVDERRIVRVEGRYERNPGIALEAFFSRGQEPGNHHRTTAQGFAGYRIGDLRLGGQYVWQERESTTPGVADQSVTIESGFVVWDVRPKKADVFARVDRVGGELGGVDTGLPDAGSVDYLLLSPNSPFTTWIIGGEWYLTSSVRVGPNVELVNYEHDPDPVNLPGRDETRLYRLTFFWTF